MSRLRDWLQVYRFIVEDGLIREYANTLAGLTEEELEISLETAKRENKNPGYAPDVKIIYDIAMEMREGWAIPDDTPCEYDSTWLEDEEWKALKGKVGILSGQKQRPLLSEGAIEQDKRRQEFYKSPEQMQKWAAQREYLMAHYLSQDLNDGNLRHPSEVAAVKASRPKSRRTKTAH